MILAGIEMYRANPATNSPMIDPLVLRLVPEEPAIEQAILTRALLERVYTLPPKQAVHWQH
jgi:hypothetical protein